MYRILKHYRMDLPNSETEWGSTEEIDGDAEFLDRMIDSQNSEKLRWSYVQNFETGWLSKRNMRQDDGIK